MYTEKRVWLMNSLTESLNSYLKLIDDMKNDKMDWDMESWTYYHNEVRRIKDDIDDLKHS